MVMFIKFPTLLENIILWYVGQKDCSYNTMHAINPNLLAQFFLFYS